MYSLRPLFSIFNEKWLYILTTARDLVSRKKNWKTESNTKVSTSLKISIIQYAYLIAKTIAACTAYTRFVLDTGHTHGYLHLQVAMLPCLIGYGAIADRLIKSPNTRTTEQGSIYYKWIKNYVAEDYTEAVIAGKQLVEKAVQEVGRKTLEELATVFATACRVSFH